MNPWLATLVEGVDWLFDRWRHEADPRSVAFDTAHGVDTARWTLDYEPALPATVEAVLEALPDRARQAAFYDLGCGKGRVLLLASTLPFRRVVGVEVVPSLVTVCRRNLQAWDRRHPACGPVEVLHSDALDLVLPANDLVVFLYNPFGAEGVGRVLDQLARRRDPGSRCWLAYVNPLEGHLLQAPWVPVAEGGEGTERWTIHRLDG